MKPQYVRCKCGHCSFMLHHPPRSHGMVDTYLTRKALPAHRSTAISDWLVVFLSSPLGVCVKGVELCLPVMRAQRGVPARANRQAAGFRQGLCQRISLVRAASSTSTNGKQNISMESDCVFENGILWLLEVSAGGICAVRSLATSLHAYR